MSSEKSEMLVSGNGEVATKSAIQKIAEKIAMVIRARTLKNQINHTRTEWWSGGVGPQGETYPRWHAEHEVERWSWETGYSVKPIGSATVDGKNGLVYTAARDGKQVRIAPPEGTVCSLCEADTNANAISVADLVFAAARFADMCCGPTAHKFEDLADM